MTRIVSGILMCVALLAASPTRAQDYPTKVPTMVVPFAAGGPTVRDLPMAVVRRFPVVYHGA